jgi:creatinine amidohydrolase
MSMLLGDMTSQDFQTRASSSVAIVPIGAIEPHGPHLPLASDTLISEHFAARLAEDLLEFDTEALIAPSIGYGVHTPPQRLGGTFPGMITISGTTFTRLVSELLAALVRDDVRYFVLLNSSFCNVPFLCEAARQLTDESADVRVMVVCWYEVVGERFRNDLAAQTGVSRTDDHHAGMVESSLVMHIAPQTVHPERLGPDHGDERTARRFSYHVYPVPADAVTASGVVYTAAEASSELGKRVVGQCAKALMAAVRLEFGLAEPDDTKASQ